jgi:hypothetical protein
MLLKKIHLLVNKNINETILLIKDFKESREKIRVLENSSKIKDDKIQVLENIVTNQSNEIKALSSDILVLSNFAKELYLLWEESALEESDLFDFKSNKAKKKNNYH